MNQSSKSIITVLFLILPMVIVGALVCWPIVKNFPHFDDRSEMFGAEFSSPTNPTNKILFIDDHGGHVDREFFLYVERNHQKPQLVAKLQEVEETGRIDFAGVQWTKDGQAIICSLTLTRRDNDKQPAAAVIAYDFNANKSIVPYPGGISVSPTYTESKWQEAELPIQKLIAAHGGLDDGEISEEMVVRNETITSFQSNPIRP